MKIRELMAESITDDWFKDGSFKAFKRAKPISYELATAPGTVDTLEGPVKHAAGFYIITGPKGERYPVPPAKFKELYDDNGDGTATPKKIIKLAKVADHDGSVDTSWGEKLNYTAGNDVIVQHGSNDYGVVKKDIFAQTYETV
jgi:PGDYG protein